MIAVGVFLVYTGVAIYGCTRLQEGLPLSELSPDDHYLKKYIERHDETFGQDENDIAHLYFRNVDASEPDVQAKMFEARKMSFESNYLTEE